MSSLSGKQVGEIKNLYESIYTEETVDEVLEEISDDELFIVFLECFLDSALDTLAEANLLNEDIILDESINLDEKYGFGYLQRFMTNKFGRRFLGGKTRIPPKILKKAEKKYGGPIDPKSSRLLNRQDVKTIDNVNTGKKTVDERGLKGDFLKGLRDAVIGGTVSSLGATPLGQSILNRFRGAAGGAVKGAGQGFMQDPKPENKPENNPNNNSGIYLDKDGTIKYK